MCVECVCVSVSVCVAPHGVAPCATQLCTVWRFGGTQLHNCVTPMLSLSLSHARTHTHAHISGTTHETAQTSYV
jgi:hypothetical protein